MSAEAPSILIVHPDPDAREHLVRSLHGEPWTIHSAEDAIAGVVGARQTRPSLLVAALCMPDMSGLELLRTLREEGIDSLEALSERCSKLFVAQVIPISTRRGWKPHPTGAHQG